MLLLFKGQSFQTEKRDGAFYFFKIAIIKRLAILRDLILKVNCCITHTVISDYKIDPSFRLCSIDL